MTTTALELAGRAEAILDDGIPSTEVATVALVSIAQSLATLSEWGSAFDDCGPIEQIARSLSSIDDRTAGS